MGENEKYLRGVFDTYVKPTLDKKGIKDTYENWFEQTKDNTEYKQGLFNKHIKPKLEQKGIKDDFNTWDNMVYGTQPSVEQKKNQQEVTTQEPIKEVITRNQEVQPIQASEQPTIQDIQQEQVDSTPHIRNKSNTRVAVDNTVNNAVDKAIGNIENLFGVKKPNKDIVGGEIDYKALENYSLEPQGSQSKQTDKTTKFLEQSDINISKQTFDEHLQEARAKEREKNKVKEPIENQQPKKGALLDEVDTQTFQDISGITAQRRDFEITQDKVNAVKGEPNPYDPETDKYKYINYEVDLALAEQKKDFIAGFVDNTGLTVEDYFAWEDIYTKHLEGLDIDNMTVKDIENLENKVWEDFGKLLESKEIALQRLHAEGDISLRDTDNGLWDNIKTRTNYIFGSMLQNDIVGAAPMMVLSIFDYYEDMQKFKGAWEREEELDREDRPTLGKSFRELRGRNAEFLSRHKDMSLVQELSETAFNLGVDFLPFGAFSYIGKGLVKASPLLRYSTRIGEMLSKSKVFGKVAGTKTAQLIGKMGVEGHKAGLTMGGTLFGYNFTQEAINQLSDKKFSELDWEAYRETLKQGGSGLLSGYLAGNIAGAGSVGIQAWRSNVIKGAFYSKSMVGGRGTSLIRESLGNAQGVDKVISGIKPTKLPRGAKIKLVALDYGAPATLGIIEGGTFAVSHELLDKGTLKDMTIADFIGEGLKFAVAVKSSSLFQQAGASRKMRKGFSPDVNFSKEKAFTGDYDIQFSQHELNKIGVKNSAELKALVEDYNKAGKEYSKTKEQVAKEKNKPDKVISEVTAKEVADRYDNHKIQQILTDPNISEYTKMKLLHNGFGLMTNTGYIVTSTSSPIQVGDKYIVQLYQRTGKGKGEREALVDEREFDNYEDAVIASDFAMDMSLTIKGKLKAEELNKQSRREVNERCEEAGILKDLNDAYATPFSERTAKHDKALTTFNEIVEDVANKQKAKETAEKEKFDKQNNENSEKSKETSKADELDVEKEKETESTETEKQGEKQEINAEKQSDIEQGEQEIAIDGNIDRPAWINEDGEPNDLIDSKKIEYNGEKYTIEVFIDGRYSIGKTVKKDGVYRSEFITDKDIKQELYNKYEKEKAETKETETKKDVVEQKKETEQESKTNDSDAKVEAKKESVSDKATQKVIEHKEKELKNERDKKVDEYSKEINKKAETDLKAVDNKPIDVEYAGEKYDVVTNRKGEKKVRNTKKKNYETQKEVIEPVIERYKDKVRQEKDNIKLDAEIKINDYEKDLKAKDDAKLEEFLDEKLEIQKENNRLNELRDKAIDDITKGVRLPDYLKDVIKDKFEKSIKEGKTVSEALQDAKDLVNKTDEFKNSEPERQAEVNQSMDKVIDKYKEKKGRPNKKEDLPASETEYTTTLRDYFKSLRQKQNVLHKEFKQFVNEVTKTLKDNKAKLSDATYNSILNRIADVEKEGTKWSSEDKKEALLNYIDEKLAEAEFNEKKKDFFSARKKIIKSSGKKKYGSRYRDLVNQLEGIDINSLTESELQDLNNKLNKLVKEGNRSNRETITDILHTTQKYPRKVMLEKGLQSLEDANKKMSELPKKDDIIGIDDLRKVILKSNNLRRNVDKLYQEKKITEAERDDFLKELDKYDKDIIKDKGDELYKELRDNADVEAIELVDEIHQSRDNFSTHAIALKDAALLAARNYEALRENGVEFTLSEMADIENAFRNMRDGHVIYHTIQTMISLDATLKFHKIQPTMDKIFSKRRGIEMIEHGERAKGIWSSITFERIEEYFRVSGNAIHNALHRGTNTGYVKAETRRLEWINAPAKAIRDIEKYYKKKFGLSKGRKATRESMHKIGIAMLELEHQSNNPDSKHNFMDKNFESRDEIMGMRDKEARAESREVWQKIKNDGEYFKNGIFDYEEFYDDLRPQEKKLLDAVRDMYDMTRADAEYNSTKEGREFQNFLNYVHHDTFRTLSMDADKDMSIIDGFMQQIESPFRAASSSYERVKNAKTPVNTYLPDIIDKYTRELASAVYVNDHLRSTFKALDMYRKYYNGKEFEKADIDKSYEPKTVTYCTEGYKRTMGERVHRDRYGADLTKIEKAVSTIYSWIAYKYLGNPTKIFFELPQNYLRHVMSNRTFKIYTNEAYEKLMSEEMFREDASRFSVDIGDHLKTHGLKEAHWGKKAINFNVLFSDHVMGKQVFASRFNREFKKQTGERFDVDKYNDDADYKIKYEKEIDASKEAGIKRTQELFNTKVKLDMPTHVRFGIGKVAFNADRQKLLGKNLYFLMSFTHNEFRQMDKSINRMANGIRTGNMREVFEGFNDVVAFNLSNYVYFQLRFLANQVLRSAYQKISGAIFNDEELKAIDIFEDAWTKYYNKHFTKEGIERDVFLALKDIFLGKYPMIATPLINALMGIVLNSENLTKEQKWEIASASNSVYYYPFNFTKSNMEDLAKQHFAIKEILSAGQLFNLIYDISTHHKSMGKMEDELRGGQYATELQWQRIILLTSSIFNYVRINPATILTEKEARVKLYRLEKDFTAAINEARKYDAKPKTKEEKELEKQRREDARDRRQTILDEVSKGTKVEGTTIKARSKTKNTGYASERGYQ